MGAPLVIGLDVGGTKILGGVMDRQGAVLARHELETPLASQESVVAALDDVVETLLDDRISAIGYGLPCRIDLRTGLALQATNLPLENLDLATHSRERFGLPVGVENDANAAALAEWHLGAGRGTETMLMLTLGTGVGGGVVLDGSLYRGWAELGHVVVQANGPPCQGNCHGRGHLETLVSGTAGDRAAQELFGPDASAQVLIDHAGAGDAEALAKLGQMGEFLGAAIGSFVNLFNPEIVVVGGGFGEAAGDLLLEPARKAARREALTPADRRLRIVPAELGPEAGLVGAALVAFGALEGTR